MPPIRNVQVTLRGKKYDVEDVNTVQDVQDKVKEMSGVGDQLVLFEGKRLESGEVLSDAGVAEGAQLNMVPTSTKKTKKSASTTASAGAAAATATASTVTAAEASDPMQDYLKKAGIDTDQLDEMVKNMGIGSGEGGAPSLKESMETMSGLMNSPLFMQYMQDPEKLEQSRQMILNNPMLKGMMAGMPGMEELLNDPNAFREAMQAAASMYQDMDKDQLLSAMMGGMSGAPPPGLFDGTLDQSAAAAAAALEELDEDD